jgi:hypothetical protein
MAAIAATKTIPVVVSFGGDPVKLGYVAGLNHPGGNVTGVTVFSTDLETKRLELINEVVPRGEIIGYLFDPNIDFADVGRRDVETAARRIGRDIRIVEVSKDADLEKAFATVAEVHAGGILMAANPLFNNLRDHVLALTTRLKLPANRIPDATQKFVRALPQEASACFTYLCLLDFRDTYYARSRLLDHLSNGGFDYWSDGLFHFPLGFLHWRTFGLGRFRWRSLARLDAPSRLSFWPLSSLLYF